MPSDHRSRLRPWLVPSAYATGAIVLGIVLPRLETFLFPALASPVTAGAALTIYAAVASGMISLTGIVFSLAFLMVQFSATAYSPRLALLMARDPLLAHALGMFIATFVYAIAALAWLNRISSQHVPLISFTLVIALLLASMAIFIALVERIGMLQVNRMLTFTADQGRQVIATTYPSSQSPDVVAAPSNDFTAGSPTQVLIHHGQPRAIQHVDFDALLQIAVAHNAVVELAASVGDTVVELTPLLQVFGATRPIDEKGLLDAIQLGEQRTFDQDPKYAIRLLVDIGIKALSPAINDPTTATQALDQIGDLLVRLGHRRIEIGNYHDDQGKLRLIVPFPTWEDFLRLAFDEIRHYGADSVQVMRRMSALVSDLISVLPEHRRAALVYWQRRLHGTILRSFSDVDEQSTASVEDRQGLGTTRRRSVPA